MQLSVITLYFKKTSYFYFINSVVASFCTSSPESSVSLLLIFSVPCSCNEVNNQPPLQLEVAGLRSLGGGVAYRLHCPALQSWHRQLQQLWQAQLTPQDRQPLQPHITVQNKVAPPVARQLLQQLETGFAPFQVQASGLQLWAYMGGPWQLLQQYPFATPSGQAAAV